MCSKNYSLEEVRSKCSNIEQSLLDMYLNRKKQKEICNILNITRSKIDAFIKKYNLKRFRDRKNYYCKNIDVSNPNFWYFLGLFASDGNMYVCGGIDVIQFTLDDKEALEDIKNILGYTGNIYEYSKLGKIRYYLKISDSNLINIIKSIFGNCYRKTKTLIFPHIKNNNNLIMFLRGFIDGDGSFTKYSNPDFYKFKLYCASSAFISNFNALISVIINGRVSKKHLYITENSIEVSSIEAVYNLFKFLYSYNPNIGIIRKRERAMQHIRNYELKI